MSGHFFSLPAKELVVSELIKAKGIEIPKIASARRRDIDGPSWDMLISRLLFPDPVYIQWSPLITTTDITRTR